MQFIKKHKSEIIFSAILAVFCALAAFDFYNKSAVAFVESNFTFALTNIGVVAGLKIICGALPLSDGIADILDKIFGFFFLANILIGIQYIMLLVNKLVIFKVLIVVLFCVRLIPKMPNLRAFSTKFLIILLFFNPGLNLYVNLVAIIANEANMSLEKDINAQINDIKKYLGVAQLINVPEIAPDNDSRTTTQKIIGSIAIFGDNLEKGADKAFDTLSHPIDSTKSALDSLKSKITDNILFIAKALNLTLKLAIKYILNVFFLYFLMPLLYFYALYKILSNEKLQDLRESQNH